MKKFAVFALILALLGSGIGTVAAQKPTGVSESDVLYETDFSAGIIPEDFSTSSTNWQVRPVKIDGISTLVLAGSSPPGGDTEFFSIRNGSSWTDYAVEMRARFQGNQGFLLVTRLDLSNEACIGGYSAAILPNLMEASLNATSAMDCNVLELLELSSAPFPMDTWVVMRIETVGNSFAIYVDGIEYMSAQGGITGSGTFAMFLLDMSVEIEYLRITTITGGGKSNTIPVANTSPLVSYAGTPQNAIAELVQKGVVPNTGQFLFQEPSASYSGIGNGFAPLYPDQLATNVVMGGTLTFTAAGGVDAFETCFLSLRIAVDSNSIASHSVNADFMNDGSLLVREGDSGEIVDYEIIPLNLDLSIPHHMLLVAIGSSLSVYVDGVLQVSGFTIAPVPGFYGVGLVGEHKASRCDGSNIWAYSFD